MKMGTNLLYGKKKQKTNCTSASGKAKANRFAIM